MEGYFTRLTDDDCFMCEFAIKDCECSQVALTEDDD